MASEQRGDRGRRKPLPLRTRLLIAGLTALVGFGIVTQVRQTSGDELSSLRQDDLVRLLDEITTRNEELVSERQQLRQDRANLQSGSDQERYLQEYASLQEILAGTVPVEGPGVSVSVSGGDLHAQQMVHMLEELRNAGAEAIEISGHRLAAGSWFLDADGAITADGEELPQPYEWNVIGSTETIRVALEIPGGALATFRNAGAEVELTEQEHISIESVRALSAPEYATPSPGED